MTDYTPTTDQVREWCADDGGLAEYHDPINGHREAERARQSFDRWLRAERATQARFWTKVARTDDENCWLWMAGTNPNGYGMFKAAGLYRGAHLFAYEWLVGPVPAGLELDHLCRVRHCVNPRHLEAVTHQENMLRSTSPVGENAKKKFCPRGHELVEGNLVPSTAKRKARQCLICSREHAREYRARKKAEDA